MEKGTVSFEGDQDHPVVRRVTNTGSTLDQQLAFEILRPDLGHFGAADRTAARAYTLVLDVPRVRAWRVTLSPGATADAIIQNGPGLRVILAGSRLIETVPGQIGHETTVAMGEAMVLTPGRRSLTNAGETPLEAIEFELR